MHSDYRSTRGGERHEMRRYRSRSRSPRRSHQQTRQIRALPYGAQPLSSHDMHSHSRLFELYLDIQKQLVLEDLDEKEARGRWKSFVGKWNRGELAEGWYDPATMLRANRPAVFPTDTPPSPAPPGAYQRQHDGPLKRNASDVEDDDDIYGPELPPTLSNTSAQRAGAAVPSLQDLELRREQAQEDQQAAVSDLRKERRKYRKQEQSRLDELAPKAEAGTKERQMEKRREVAAANSSFAVAKTEAGGTVDMRDEDLMGGNDGVEEYRKAKNEIQRKKNERELRREEILRARQAEKEERVRAYREKEDKTMAGLIALAKQRYG